MNFLSHRVQKLAESETLAMARLGNELKEKGVNVINMSLGEPDFPTPDFVKAAGKEAIDKNFSYYTPVPGYKDLLEAIAVKFERDNNLHYKPSQIVVSTGAKQSIINVVMATINPGDEVILPAPYWVSYSEMVQLNEGVVVSLETDYKSDFKISPAQLERAITPKTKMLSGPRGSQLMSWVRKCSHMIQLLMPEPPIQRSNIACGTVSTLHSPVVRSTRKSRLSMVSPLVLFDVSRLRPRC
jgi:aspartate aminotransferase